jgi:hypothetical protein
MVVLGCFTIPMLACWWLSKSIDNEPFKQNINE